MNIDEYFVDTDNWEKLKSEDLDLMAHYGNRNTRFLIAGHKNVSAKTLSNLMHDPDYNIRYWVAKNKNSDAIILKHLAEDIQSEVRYQAIRNANVTVETLIKRASSFEDKGYIRLTAQSILNKRMNERKENILYKIKSFLFKS